MKLNTVYRILKADDKTIVRDLVLIVAVITTIHIASVISRLVPSRTGPKSSSDNGNDKGLTEHRSMHVPKLYNSPNKNC